jgi:hypothetical protein
MSFLQTRSGISALRTPSGLISTTVKIPSSGFLYFGYNISDGISADITLL